MLDTEAEALCCTLRSVTDSLADGLLLLSREYADVSLYLLVYQRQVILWVSDWERYLLSLSGRTEFLCTVFLSRVIVLSDRLRRVSILPAIVEDLRVVNNAEDWTFNIAL